MQQRHRRRPECRRRGFHPAYGRGMKTFTTTDCLVGGVGPFRWSQPVLFQWAAKES